MNFLQLKYFQVIATLEHMGKASKELKISQPYLSKTISSLEDELNAKLFDRKGKYIVLNDNGKILLDAVNKAFSILEKSIDEIQFSSKLKNKELRLLALSCSYLLPKLLTSFKSKYPNIKLKIFQNIESNKSINDYDLCIFSTHLINNSPNTITLLEEEIYLALPLNHPLSNFDEIYLKEFNDDEFISLEKTKSFRKTTDDLCKIIGFKPTIGLECDSPSTLRGLIRSGDGVAFIPQITWGLEENEFIKFVHIKDYHCMRYINLSWTKNDEKHESIECFKEFIKIFFKNLSNKYA